MNIAMWSGPRNLSTALMYAFAQRADCTVWDEPFYAAYLAATGIDHPMRDQIIAGHEADPAKVAATCEKPGAETHFYQKHMTLHMIPGFPRGFMRACQNVFLIRHPARVIASYAKKRETPTLLDIGFVQQAALFDQVSDWQGKAPVVLDSADIRADPQRALTRLCAALGMAFVPGMLRWPAGPKPYDGVWAPHWYGAVHQSSGFEGDEGPLPVLSGADATLSDDALPFYARLWAYRI
jgi:hypothetical protein